WRGPRGLEQPRARTQRARLSLPIINSGLPRAEATRPAHGLGRFVMGRCSRFLYSVVSLLVPLYFLGLGVSEASALPPCSTTSAPPLGPPRIAGAAAQAPGTSFETAAGPLILVDYEDPPTMAHPLSSDPIVVPPLTTMGSPTPIDVVKDH